jgi:hypothetical protein
LNKIVLIKKITKEEFNNISKQIDEIIKDKRK